MTIHGDVQGVNLLLAIARVYLCSQTQRHLRYGKFIVFDSEVEEERQDFRPRVVNLVFLCLPGRDTGVLRKMRVQDTRLVLEWRCLTGSWRPDAI